MTKRILVSGLIGIVLSFGPFLLIFLNRMGTNRSVDWVGALLIPGAVLAAWVPGLEPHDRPFLIWSVVLSGLVYAGIAFVVLQRRLRC